MPTRLIATLVVVCGVIAVAAVGGAREGTRTAAPPEAKAQPSRAQEPAPEAEGRLVTPEEALRMDAHEIAKRYGISDEESLRRLELQSTNVISAFEHRVRAREKPRYGGLYIQREPDYRIVVLLTSGDISDIDDYVPDRLRGLVVVRRVERTLEELKAMHERVSRLRSLVSFDSATYVMTNRVELHLVAPTQAELEATTQMLRDAAVQSGEPLPDWVVIDGSVVPVDRTPGEWSDELVRRSPVGAASEMGALISGILDLDLGRGCFLLSGTRSCGPQGRRSRGIRRSSISPAVLRRDRATPFKGAPVRCRELPSARRRCGSREISTRRSHAHPNLRSSCSHVEGNP
jgi:hypothetical protein